MGKKRCGWCREWFEPHPRLEDRQKSCGRSVCKRKQKRLSQRNLQRRDCTNYKQAQRDWRDKNPGYWKNYRKEHPAYERRNRIQSRLRWQQSKLTLQKRIDILEVTEKTMEYWNPILFAKQPRSTHPLLWAYTGGYGNLENRSP